MPPVIDPDKTNSQSTRFDALPYRPCAGICLIRDGLVFSGRRLDGGETSNGSGGNLWQMPQGGIDEGETPVAAVWREMEEEIGTRAARLLGEIEDWITYDLPADLLGKVWKGRYRGQKQKWFAFAFEGVDADINIETEHPEFSQWQWMHAADLVADTVPFKRDVYARVFEEFARFLK